MRRAYLAFIASATVLVITCQTCKQPSQAYYQATLGALDEINAILNSGRPVKLSPPGHHDDTGVWRAHNYSVFHPGCSARLTDRFIWDDGTVVVQVINIPLDSIDATQLTIDASKGSDAFPYYEVILRCKQGETGISFKSEAHGKTQSGVLPFIAIGTSSEADARKLANAYQRLIAAYQSEGC